MDNIATYNSDINTLRENIVKNNKVLNELGDTEKIQKIKNYEGIKDEINKILYRERIIFGVSCLVALSITIVTVKTI